MTIVRNVKTQFKYDECHFGVQIIAYLGNF